MTTITVSVKNKRDAGLLIRMLKKISFVERVEETGEVPTPVNQFEKLKSFLAAHSESCFFNEIPDPVSWQKQLRNEWEKNDSIINEVIRLRKKSRIKLPDAIILATAIVCGCTLVTHNTSDFIAFSSLIHLVDPLIKM